MTRLTLTALLALAVLLAGCSTAAGPTPTPQERTVIVERTLPTPTPAVETRSIIVERTVFVNRTVTVTVHPSPTFDPTVSFLACDRVAIDAPAYNRVALTTADGVENHRANYSGRETFTATEPISEVMVFGSDDAVVVERDGAVYADCLVTPTPTPTPTATAPEPTAAPKTVVVTRTVEVTPTPSPTPTPEPPAENDINLFWEESVENGVYTVDVQARNFYDGPVDLTLGIVLYADHDSSVYSEERRNANFDGPDVGWTFTVTYDGDRVADVQRAEVFVIEVERA